MTGAQQTAATAIDAPGTPETQWAGWDGLLRLPTAVLPRGPVLVVAAHPDDEVLGFGGAMATLAAGGSDVHLVSVTEGEGSHPRSTLVSPAELVVMREAELERALADLGLPGLRPRRLRVPDTRVHAHQDKVQAHITAALRETGAVLCAAPWTGDLHSDHEAAGQAARAACRAAGVPVWLYPVWMWHWARPGDRRVPWQDAARIALPSPASTRKQLAIQRFTSQIMPLGAEEGDAAVLPSEELAHHVRPFEVVFR
ncbi:PIG-L deacetylase family protein [Streptomyces sp. NBC_01089]|uniref:PIG-L deacetylase family protein n=1 Tax=Streptomyces sp. NBC_01089 TaxID=2903747 RepID=UPI00386BB3E8|nr:PIG-L family deacetylase [Streptomyces sp. NBC_01089]